MDADPKKVMTWVVIVVVPVVAAGFVAGLLQFIDVGTFLAIIKNHFAVTIGLPMASLLSTFIVVALKHSGGPMRFEGLGFKFEGSSCEVILWVMCFLAISCSIRLLWSIG
jgi:hypothetical protein